MAKQVTVSPSLGCIPLVVSILAIWALCFGVTVGGKHYGLSCSCNRGVGVDVGAP